MATAAAAPEEPVMKIYQQVFENNRKWVAEVLANIREIYHLDSDD